MTNRTDEMKVRSVVTRMRMEGSIFEVEATGCYWLWRNLRASGGRCLDALEILVRVMIT